MFLSREDEQAKQVTVPTETIQARVSTSILPATASTATIKTTVAATVPVTINNVPLELQVINRTRIYYLRSSLKPGNYDLTLDGELHIEVSIDKNVSLYINTPKNTTFNNNIDGTITIVNQSQKINQVYVCGEIKGIVRTLPRVNMIVSGNIHGDSQIVNKECLRCDGAVASKAKIKGNEVRFENTVFEGAIVEAEKIEINSECNPNIGVLKTKFKCKSFVEFTVTYEVIERADLDLNNYPMSDNTKEEIEEQTENWIDDYAQEIEVGLLTEKPTFNPVQSSKPKVAKPVVQEESLSDIDDDEISEYINPKYRGQSQAATQKTSQMPKAVSSSLTGNSVAKKLPVSAKPQSQTTNAYSQLKNPIAKPKQSNLDNQTFYGRKEKIFARMKQFNDYLAQAKQVKTPNGKIIEPRKHQIRDLRSLEENFRRGNFHGYFHETTGAGKTMLSLLCMLAMTNNAKDFDLKILFVVPQTNLINQTIAEIIQFYPNLSIGVFDGDHKKIGQHITITTYNSFSRQLNKENDEDKQLRPEMFAMVFYDEAHHILPKNFHPLVPLSFKYGPVIGITATDKYNTVRDPHSLVSVDQVLPTCFGRFDRCEAIDNKVLAPCHNVIINVHTRINVQAIRNKNLDKHKNTQDVPEWAEEEDYNEHELAKKLNENKLNMIAIELIAKGVNMFNGERLDKQSGIIFAAGIKHAQEMARLINYYFKDHPDFKDTIKPAEWISGTLSKSERARILKDVDEGRIRVICNADILGEGCNLKILQWSMNMLPTLANVKAGQRDGRDKRVCIKLPNKVAITFDFAYGIPQIFSHEFTKGRRTYGVCKLVNKKFEYDDLIEIPREEIMDYDIDSDGFCLAKSKVLKPQLKVVDKELQETCIPEDDSYLYDIYDLGLLTSNVTNMVSAPAPTPSKATEFSKKNARSEVTDMSFSMFQSDSKRQKTNSGNKHEVQHQTNSNTTMEMSK